MFICPIWRLPSTRSPTIKKSRTIAVRALIRERNQTNARVIALSSSALPARTYLTPVPHCKGRPYNGSGHCQGRACNNSALRLATPCDPKREGRDPASPCPLSHAVGEGAGGEGYVQVRADAAPGSDGAFYALQPRGEPR